jgi:hypothetical protein
VSIVASELIVYASANIPDVDTGTNGGAIDAKRRLVFTQIAANDDIEVISTSASDTQNCTITARGADGVITTQTAALTGTTAKIFNTLGAAGVVERVLKVDLASDAVGTITVRRSVAGATIGTIPATERGFLAAFINAASDASGGSSRDFYRKVFVKNTNATLALLGATIGQSADPDARITHALETTVNGTGTATDRRTVPASGVGTFDDTTKSVPGTDLAAGAAVGVWLKLTLPAGDPPHRSTYDLAIAGSTA